MDPATDAAAIANEHPARQLWPALYFLGYFVAVGVLAWAIEGHVGQLLFFGIIGLATGGGLLFHALARPKRRRIGRAGSQWVVGLGLFLGAGVFGRQSFQIEGFFFHVLAGVAGGVVVHYLVAKIVGPLLIGRGWCGWGCWIAMVLDRLPWKRSPGRRAGWGRLRTAHFAASLALVAALALLLGYDHGFTWQRTDGLWWFLGGSAAYYGAGVALAVALRDDRAFCKYACPVAVFLRLGSRLSLLSVKGGRTRCTECHACEKACPMDVPVQAIAGSGGRVRDPECTLCLECVAACSRGNLGLAVGLGGPRAR